VINVERAPSGTETKNYHFVTTWRVEATCGEVADIIGNPVDLPRWWPSVCLGVEELAPPGPGGVGRRVRLHTKGWLPYTLHWELTVVESNYPHGSTIEARGDFDGRGVWRFVQDGLFVDITYDWRIRAEKPLLRNLSFLLKPLFGANHRWAMAQGEQSLKLELLRRRAISDESRAAIPAPPGPVTYSAAAIVGAAALAGAGLVYLLIRSSRRRR
jgi:Polyketide cyclase / dehydrase and lipid transport